IKIAYRGLDGRIYYYQEPSQKSGGPSSYKQKVLALEPDATGNLPSSDYGPNIQTGLSLRGGNVAFLADRIIYVFSPEKPIELFKTGGAPAGEQTISDASISGKSTFAGRIKSVQSNRGKHYYVFTHDRMLFRITPSENYIVLKLLGNDTYTISDYAIGEDFVVFSGVRQSDKKKVSACIQVENGQVKVEVIPALSQLEWRFLKTLY
ncbi:MAG: hypothetical protein AAF975_08405, partial [Spirochaetota bacterium]